MYKKHNTSSYRDKERIDLQANGMKYYLQRAGLNDKMLEIYMTLIQEDSIKELKQKLFQEKRKLLESIRLEGYYIDRIDYMIYNIAHEQTKEEK